MTSNQKKAFILLQAVVFYFHDLDANELAMLYSNSKELGDNDAVEWALKFMGTDRAATFDKSREFIRLELKSINKDEKLDLLNTTWEQSNLKGFITEMEAIALLKFSKDLGIEQEFIETIRCKRN